MNPQKGSSCHPVNFKLIFFFLAFYQMAIAESFRVVSYNILSNQFIHEGIYDHVPSHLLAWKNRREKIVDRLKNLEPDLICLQELNKDSFHYFQSSLHEYEGFFVEKKGLPHDGVGTFCKKNVFNVLVHKPIFCKGTSKCGKFDTQPALFTSFELGGDGCKVTVINTKIRWSEQIKPGDPIWNHVHFIINEMPRTSTIVLGDFNMPPKHALIKEFIAAGLRDPFEKDSPPTCFANGEIKRIDYILITNDLHADPLVLAPITIEKPIPNEQEPSDHLPIGCIITK